jgi:hypothetical protein
MPVLFVRDAYKFPDFIHTQKRHPKTNMRSPTAMWDFWSLSPESLHQVTIRMSDRGLPVSVRNMYGYGSHTYSLINDKGERHWVKFHFKTVQGHKHWTNKEATEIVGRTRESTQEDLYNSIETGDFPRWKMQVQIMPESDVGKHWYKPFDLTKVWPHADYPPIDLGVLELNRNRRDRAARRLAVEHRSRHRLLAGQDVAGAHLLLYRRASLSARHALRDAAGEPRALSGAPLSQGRTDAVLRAEDRQRRCLLRTELVRRRCSSTAPRQCGACRRRSWSASSATSPRCIRTMRPACAARSPT